MKNIYEDVILALRHKAEEATLSLNAFETEQRILELSKSFLKETAMPEEERKIAIQKILDEEIFISKKIASLLATTSPEQEFIDRVNGQIFIPNETICSILKSETRLPWKSQVTYRDGYKLVFYEDKKGRFFDIKSKDTRNNLYIAHSLENMNWFDAFLRQRQTNDGKTEYEISSLQLPFTLPETYDKIVKWYFKTLEVDLQHPEKLISYFSAPSSETDDAKSQQGKHSKTHL